MITNFSASDQILIPHDLWISDERQMINRLKVRDQLSQWNNTVQGSKQWPLHYKSDILLTALIGWINKTHQLYVNLSNNRFTNSGTQLTNFTTQCAIALINGKYMYTKHGQFIINGSAQKSFYSKGLFVNPD